MEEVDDEEVSTSLAVCGNESGGRQERGEKREEDQRPLKSGGGGGGEELRQMDESQSQTHLLTGRRLVHQRDEPEHTHRPTDILLMTSRIDEKHRVDPWSDGEPREHILEPTHLRLQ